MIEVKKALWKYVDRCYDKQNRSVTLNSIDNKCFKELYNACFDLPEKILEYCDNYKSSNKFEKRVIDNFKILYSRISQEFPKDNADDLLDFADYLMNYVQIIAIDSNCNVRKTFSIFESINSKGKTLDEIDKIK